MNRTMTSKTKPQFRSTHSRDFDGNRHVWNVERLWPQAADLPVKQVPLAQIAELDEDSWFCGKPPTIRAVADHCRRIMNADLEQPIILNADGSLMDGGHRVARAYLEGRETLPAVQFPTMPEPDAVEPL